MLTAKKKQTGKQELILIYLPLIQVSSHINLVWVLVLLCFVLVVCFHTCSYKKLITTYM